MTKETPELSDYWRPIDTAPLNTRRVLLFVDFYGAGSGHYSDGKWNLHFCLNKDATPTHWMELPKCPKKQ